MKKMFATLMTLAFVAGCATGGTNNTETILDRLHRLEVQNQQLQAQHRHDLEQNAILAGGPPPAQTAPVAQAAPQQGPAIPAPAPQWNQPSAPRPMDSAPVPPPVGSLMPGMMPGMAAGAIPLPPPCFPEDGSAYAPIDTEGRAFVGPDPDPIAGHPDTIRLVMANHSVFMGIIFNHHPVNVVVGMDMPQTVITQNGHRCWMRGVPGTTEDHVNVYLSPDSLVGNNSLSFQCIQPRMARSFGRPTGMMIDGEIVGVRNVTGFLARPGQDIRIDGLQCRALPTNNPTF